MNKGFFNKKYLFDAVLVVKNKKLGMFNIQHKNTVKNFQSKSVKILQSPVKKPKCHVISLHMDYLEITQMRIQ